LRWTKHRLKILMANIPVPAVWLYILAGLLWLSNVDPVWSLAIQLAALGVFLRQYFADWRSRVLERTKRRGSEERIRHMAYYDDMTGLPNRRQFLKRLSEIARTDSGGHRQAVSVFSIDIDRFKLINDSLGHEYGDILLRQVAERLMRAVGPDDMVARMEGDEFAMVFPGMGTEKEVQQAAENIRAALSAPFQLQQYELRVTASIGIAIGREQGQKASELIRMADIALSRAKERGRNTYQLYHSRMSVDPMERLKMELDLRRALDERQFELRYQPQVDMVHGEIICLEALIRWKHPDKGNISPDKFIPVAEENGMIVDIGDWVILEACRQAKQWQTAGLPPVAVSVNISTRQFQQNDFARKIRSMLQEIGLDAKYLELEITESVMMDFDNASDTLKALKELGVSISIDDFGTGYSSLGYLKKLPIYKLKIDRSFIRDLLEDPSDAAIVASIVSMAKHLNLSVIAEGVESEDQMRNLRKLNCRAIQGYWISEPLSADRVFRQWQALREQAAARTGA